VSQDPRIFDTMTRDGMTSRLGKVRLGNQKVPRYQQIALAQSICATCVVRLQCLDFIRDNPNPEGIWAGTLPDERLKWTR
jgi:hypothetical protein